MKNVIVNLTSKEYGDKSPETKVSNCFIVNLEGKKIQNRTDLFDSLQKAYSLPDVNGWDSISDWLTDLSWIKTNNFN